MARADQRFNCWCHIETKPAASGLFFGRTRLAGAGPAIVSLPSTDSRLQGNINGKRRTDRNERRRRRSAARFALSRRLRKRPQADRLHVGQDAQEPHPHPRGRPGQARAVAVRPQQGPHHVPPHRTPGRHAPRRPRPQVSGASVRAPEEERQHGRRRARPAGIGVRAGRLAARPRVRRAVDRPVFRDRAAGLVVPAGAVVGAAGALVAPFARLHQCAAVRRDELLQHRLAVARMDDGVRVAVEHDDRHALVHGLAARGVLHRVQSRDHVLAAARRESGVDADGGIQLGEFGAEDGRHRTARGQAGRIHARRVHAVFRHDVARHARQDRGLAAVARALGGVEPVPAARRVGAPLLFRIEHEAVVFVRQRVHARACREIGGVLRAPVQHHDQRARRLLARRRDVELVAPRAGAAGKDAVDEAAARRGSRCRIGRRAPHARPAARLRARGPRRGGVQVDEGGTGLRVLRIRCGWRHQPRIAQGALDDVGGAGGVVGLDALRRGHHLFEELVERFHVDSLSGVSAVREGLADGGAGDECAQDLDRGDGGAGQFGRHVVFDDGQPQHVHVEFFSGRDDLFELLARIPVLPDHVALAHDGLADRVRVDQELVADRRPHEIGAVRIKAFADQQVDLGKVDEAHVDSDLVAVREALLRACRAGARKHGAARRRMAGCRARPGRPHAYPVRTVPAGVRGRPGFRRLCAYGRARLGRHAAGAGRRVRHPGRRRLVGGRGHRLRPCRQTALVCPPARAVGRRAGKAGKPVVGERRARRPARPVHARDLPEKPRPDHRAPAARTPRTVDAGDQPVGRRPRLAADRDARQRARPGRDGRPAGPDRRGRCAHRHHRHHRDPDRGYPRRPTPAEDHRRGAPDGRALHPQRHPPADRANHRPSRHRPGCRGDAGHAGRCVPGCGRVVRFHRLSDNPPRRVFLCPPV
ncbi:hypothetical protein Lal_00014798 [Lupinus albus]|nr:hypothetical protein Lal_00014798 [Lupinus albus]